MIPDNNIFSRLTDLATCLCAQNKKDGLPGTCFCGVVPGDAAVAGYSGDCSDDTCGMAWVRLVTLYPSSSVGVASIQPNNCANLLGLDVEVGIMRCMSVGDEQGNLPSPEELLAASQLQIADALAMWRAISCCDIGDVVVGQYAPIGPEGGMVGGTFLINLMEV